MPPSEAPTSEVPTATATVSSPAGAPINDKTTSVFVTRDKFNESATKVGLAPGLAEALWAVMADSSSQRIRGGATAPREDATNVNQWHWSELDLVPWAKERLSELVVGLAGKDIPDKGWVKVTKLESCEGEAAVSNRKGKRIVSYELKLKFKWEGSVDYDEVSGELLMPYVSEDVEDSNYEIKLTAKQPNDDSHKKALRYLTKELPTLKANLKKFTAEIYAK